MSTRRPARGGVCADSAGRRSRRPPRRSASIRHRRDAPPKCIVGDGYPRDASRRNALRVNAAARARWRAAARAGRRSRRPPRRSASTRRRRDAPPKGVVGNGSPRTTVAAVLRTNQTALRKLMASTCGVCPMYRTCSHSAFFDNPLVFLSRPVSMQCYTAGSTRASRFGFADMSNLKNFNFNCV